MAVNLGTIGVGRYFALLLFCSSQPTRCLFRHVKSPGTNPSLRMLVGRAADAFGPDPGIYHPGKCRKSYKSGRLA
jgi:hypothetical protein